MSIFSSTSLTFLLCCAMLWIVICRGCENIATVDVTEEMSYPSRPLLDVNSKIASHFSLSNIQDSLYLTDKIDSRPFDLYHGKLIVNGQLDREAICGHSGGSQQQRNDLSDRCCQGHCCMYIGVSWSSSSTSSKDVSKSDNAAIQTVYVRVNIRDINDNHPTFPQLQIHLMINENIKMGHSYSLPRARDEDSTEYGVIRYKLEQDRKCMACFKIIRDKNQNPLLVTKMNIDREKYSSFQMKLLAIDSDAVNPKTGTLTIKVTVNDLNDNAPLFESSTILLTLPENAKVDKRLRHIAVRDIDSDLNSQINYRIEDFHSIAQKYFKLIPVNKGVDIQLHSSLDYEQNNKFEFYIIAEDQGSPALSSTATVSVLVKNINDKPPQIYFYERGAQLEPNSLPIQKPENGPKHETIVFIHVVDQDSRSSDIMCEVSRPKNVFYLKELESTDIIARKKKYELKNSITFDRETQSLYTIEIKCSDSSLENSLTSTVTIQLRITDTNDNRPEFEVNLYFGEIKETELTEQRVIIKDGPIKVVDKDEGINSRLLFKLKNLANLTDADWFSINNNLIIQNVMALDYEDKKEYRMLLVASDGGNPVLVSSAQITIRIIDVNDNAPKFRKKFYEFTVEEEQLIGTEVGQVDAADADTEPKNADFHYSIRSIDNSINQYRRDMDASQLLMIENGSGKIKTKMVLDREKIKHLSFMVEVRNTNPLVTGRNRYDVHSSLVPVSIKILDINDNRPRLVEKRNNGEFINYKFNERPSIVINKETHPISNPCTVFPYKFVDDDEGLNAMVKVSLKKNPKFKLDMDHSLFCPISDNIGPGFYTVYVVGEDRNGNNGSCRSEYPLNVEVISPVKRYDHRIKRPPYNKNNVDTSSVDQKTVIIFIVLIAAVVVFFILLALVVIKSKICLPKYSNRDTRKLPDQNRDRHNITTNWMKPYKEEVNDSLCENKQRLWNNSYETSSLAMVMSAGGASGHHNQPKMIDPVTGGPIMSATLSSTGGYGGGGGGGGGGALINNSNSSSQSCENVTVDTTAVIEAGGHKYEPIMRNMGGGPGAKSPTWQPWQQQSQQHLYNYLLETNSHHQQQNQLHQPQTQGLPSLISSNSGGQLFLTGTTSVININHPDNSNNGDFQLHNNNVCNSTNNNNNNNSNNNNNNNINNNNNNFNTVMTNNSNIVAPDSKYRSISPEQNKNQKSINDVYLQTSFV